MGPDKLALLGGTPVRSKPFPAWPEFDDRERRYLAMALESRRWGGFPYPSAMATEFGARFAAFHGATYGLVCSNGSVSIETALRAYGIKAGDEVIAPCYTWVATAGAAVHLNAVPVLVDVEDRNWCMDPAAFEAAITPRTRAVVPVHLGASVADLDRILEIARRHGILVIEDCAHAHGAAWRGRGVGSWGDFGSFSFQSSKLMTSGEGGVILTSNDEWAQKCASIINCGRKEPGYDGFEGWLFGWNHRLSDLQVAVLMAQFERLDQATRHRAERLSYFRDLLHREVEGLRVLDADSRVTRPAAYQVVMRYDARAFKGVHRDRFLEALCAEGVDLDGTFYVPLYQNPLFHARSDEWPMLRERYGEGVFGADVHCPVAEKAAWEEAVWMHYPHLSGTAEDVETIVEAIRKVQRRAEDLR
jgi:dTDP-4-amino-4,6-dideoxygalactose transaminase